MKWKIIISLFLMIFLVSMAQGALTDNLVCSYTFDDTETISSMSVDLVNGYNLTIDGATTGKRGVVDESYSYDGINDDLNRTATGTEYDADTGDFTVNFWFNTTEVSDSEFFFEMYNTGATNDHISAQIYETGGTDYLRIHTRTATGDTGYCQRRVATSTDDSAWHMLTMIRNGTLCTDMILYVDGVLTATSVVAESGDTLDIDNMNKHVVGNSHVGTNHYSGNIDEFSYWLRAITPIEITELYNTGSGLQYPYTATATLTVNHNLVETTVDSTSLYEYITYNGTIANTNGLFNCSLYTNISNVIISNETQQDINLSLPQDFNYSYGFIDDDINFRINCSNADVADTISWYKYTVDTTRYINYVLNLDIQSTVNEIWEEINMIPVIMIWMLLTVGGFVLMSGRNYAVGLIVYGYSAIFDLFLTGWLFDTYASLANTTTYYGYMSSLLIVGLAGYTFVKVAIPIAWKRRR